MTFTIRTPMWPFLTRSNPMNLTTKQAAERLGVNEQRVRALIKTGRLKSEKFGVAHMIREKDLAAVMERKAGRPWPVKV
jgi:excisionase family DNA binding protein